MIDLRHPLVTLPDRMPASQRPRVRPLNNCPKDPGAGWGHAARAVIEAIIQLLKPYQAMVHTLTSDNGKEFAEHETSSKELVTDFYFAHATGARDKRIAVA